MEENIKLTDLYTYGVYDITPDKELNYITELASIICETPTTLLSILDQKKEWLKSLEKNKISITRIEDTFCQHAFDKPQEVLVVNDALNDDRFKNNIQVTGKPKIRFYAGAPLLTKNKEILGTLCIIDSKPKTISENQKRALQILAYKAVNKIEVLSLVNKLNTSVEINTKRLIKLTENLSIGVFEMLISKDNKLKFTFLNKAVETLYPTINLNDFLNDATIAFSILHPAEIDNLLYRIKNSIQKNERFYYEYRVKNKSGYQWHAITGNTTINAKGEKKIYGTFTDVTKHYEYQTTLEQISFDISHVLRKPVTTMLGMINLIETEKKLSKNKLVEYTSYLKKITKELEEYTLKLNKIYSEKKLLLTNNGSITKIV